MVSYRFSPSCFITLLPEIFQFHEFWGLLGGFLRDFLVIKGRLKGSEAAWRIRGFLAVWVGFSLFFALVFTGFSGPLTLLILYGI
jgi:hypothetical protein